MKSYIKTIALFDGKGNKRSVQLEKGVNIITGESKTGKSALVEIIDYCYCSKRCTIPKGKITDFATLYALVMVIGENTYVIARENWENGGKMCFVRESSDFDLKTLTYPYFDDKAFRPYKNVQYQIESALGLTITNTAVEDGEKGQKASLRNMVSYLFQHQNLMASKFALFYRFSDYYKRKEVIDQFPVFAGMIGQEYYSDLIRIDALKTKLKKKQKTQLANEKSTEYIRDNLGPLLADYFALLNRDFDDTITTQKMLQIAHHLPQYDDSQLFNNEQITKRYEQLHSELENLRNQEQELLIKITQLDGADHTGKNFSRTLHELKSQAEAAPIKTDKYICPLCGHSCDEILEQDKQLKEAMEWLDEELEFTEKYTTDFSEESRKLEKILGDTQDHIKSVWREIKTLEEKFISSKSLVSVREKINYAKSKIELYAEMCNSGIFEPVDEDIEEIKAEIESLKIKIDGFDVETKKAKAQTFLAKNMNKLAKTLDFEEEYHPVNLNFGLIDGSFDMYQYQNNREKIYLYEMGSGANWVSCHIALFLSFLRYFSIQQSCPMPLTMFFDQPSQVYFPQGNSVKKDLTESDRIAVNKMYQTIFDEVNEIGESSGVLPQLIIVDHVDGKELECRKEFESYIRCNWREGSALI